MILIFFLYFFSNSFFSWIIEFPDLLKVPIAKYITIFVKWLIEDADFGLFTFKQFTRAIGSLLDAPSLFLKGFLANGFEYEMDNSDILYIPPLSWMSVIFIFVTTAIWLKDYILAFFYINSPENIMLNTTLAKIALGGAKFEMKWGNLTAGSIISFIPIIIIYSILQRYFIRGITGSAVKE